jgi:uncharacterized membrane protein YoaK (UPF0700 family)|tara:strand:+ start:333 stop:536 length:204 start_codon:yes stop_codon:yes gene_type:complete
MNGPTNDVSKGHRMNRFLALFAFVVFAIFVGILAFEVPSPDLVIVILITMALLAYDFITSSQNDPKD